MVKPFKPGFATVKFLLVTLISLVIILAYYRMGKIQEWHKTKITEAEVMRLRQELQTPEKVIEKLKERLAEEPDSHKGWYLLGRLYRSLDQFDDAIAAYENARRLAPDEPDYINSLMEAYFGENGGYFRQKELDLLKNQGVRDLLNAEVLNLIAGYYYQHQDYENAITYWKLMEHRLEPGDVAVQREIVGAINKAEERLNHQSGPHVVVEVSVDPALLTQYPIDASVFIYAKGNPKYAPVAAVRRTLRELPVTVNLTDAESMLPGLKISKRVNYHVQLFARIEPTGRLTTDQDLPESEVTIVMKQGENKATLEIKPKGNPDAKKQ